MEFIIKLHLLGMLTGLATFLIIGLFHLLVIKAEYYRGTQAWRIFLTAGIVCSILSVFFTDSFISSLLGILAFASFWSIFEVFQQARRVKKGWFPKNPKRQNKLP